MSPSPDYKVSFDTFHNVINNEIVNTAKTRQAICPSTEEPLWDSPVSTKEDVDWAVACAKAAYPAWRKLSWDERAAYLTKLADAIEANSDSFAALLGKEAGKPPQAAGFEMFLSMNVARETPKLRLTEEKPIDDADRTAIVRHVPLGVGVGIVPWNFPLTLGIGKLFPALLAGNTFIWKPSPFSPYSALKLAEIATKVLPPGVFQALGGEEDLGAFLTAHPDVAAVNFTGSVDTGKRIMAACAGTLKRVTLELGGNDAAIVCDDVDIESVVAKITFLTFVHGGQICMNIKRIYVHARIYDRFLAAMVAATKAYKTGDHTDGEAFFGPVQNARQYARLRDLYSQISKEGWDVALGGLPDPQQQQQQQEEDGKRKGYFVTPTIIANPPDTSRIVVEEPFGPIVPVLKWSEEDKEDVIERVNASKLGLGASVWSKDVARARAMAEQLEAGSVWVNTHFELAPDVPFGGHKESGIGSEWGLPGLRTWCNTQAFWVKHT